MFDKTKPSKQETGKLTAQMAAEPQPDASQTSAAPARPKRLTPEQAAAQIARAVANGAYKGLYR